MTLQPSATQPADPQVPETSAAVFLIDPAGVITGWSPAAAGITGYTAAEIIGGGLSLLYSPEERSAGNPSADVALAARVGRSAREGWLLRKDGGKIWTDTAITALRSSVGTVSGFACFIRDRAREQAADARRRARAERISALAVSREDVATHGLDIVKLLRRIALRARELTGAEAAIIELRDGVGERARAYDGHGPLDVELGAILIPEGRTRSNGRLQCIRYDGGSESAEVLADACDRLGIGSLLAIPVLHEHATIAWIAVLSRSARTFDEQAAATLELTSTLLGASLAQAQASEQRRAQIHERSMAEAQQRGRDARASVMRWMPLPTRCSSSPPYGRRAARSSTSPSSMRIDAVRSWARWYTTRLPAFALPPSRRWRCSFRRSPRWWTSSSAVAPSRRSANRSMHRVPCT